MELGLGTVRFGAEGGSKYAEARVTQEEIRLILETAKRAGISLLDTSAQAGRSEEYIGNCMPDFPGFKVLSRAPVFEVENVGAHHAEQLERAVCSTLQKLQLEQLYGLLIQQPSDVLADHGDRLPKRMQSLKDQGMIQKIGVSVTSAAEIESVLRVFQPDIVQVPLNVLDQRLIKSGHLAAMKKRGIEIHARAIFMHGVLLELATPHPWFWPIRKKLEDYQQYLVDNGLTPVEGALSFLKCVPEIDYALVGVSSVRHLQEITDAYDMSVSDCEFSRFAVNELKYLDPREWNLYA